MEKGQEDLSLFLCSNLERICGWLSVARQTSLSNPDSPIGSRLVKGSP